MTRKTLIPFIVSILISFYGWSNVSFIEINNVRIDNNIFSKKLDISVLADKKENKLIKKEVFFSEHPKKKKKSKKKKKKKKKKKSTHKKKKKKKSSHKKKK